MPHYTNDFHCTACHVQEPALQPLAPSPVKSILLATAILVKSPLDGCPVPSKVQMLEIDTSNFSQFGTRLQRIFPNIQRLRVYFGNWGTADDKVLLQSFASNLVKLRWLAVTGCRIECPLPLSCQLALSLDAGDDCHESVNDHVTWLALYHESRHEDMSAVANIPQLLHIRMGWQDAGQPGFLKNLHKLPCSLNSLCIGSYPPCIPLCIGYSAPDSPAY